MKLCFLFYHRKIIYFKYIKQISIRKKVKIFDNLTFEPADVLKIMHLFYFGKAKDRVVAIKKLPPE